MHRDAAFRRDRRGVLNNSASFGPVMRKPSSRAASLSSSCLYSVPTTARSSLVNKGKLMRSGNVSLREFAW
jgi:hypothetical protein